MRIYATFVNWKHAPKEIEMVCAWDEFSVDNNPDGYEKDRADSLKSYEPDYLHAATVEIIIPESQVVEILNRKVVVFSGDIKEATSV